uniref:Ig-like domain-containing protein n=1 Tax=Myripristis murdjan TaxID=586833 RepID=A0A667X065_9TELE
MFVFSTGVKCETLTQPASLTVRPGQTLTINCQVSYSVSDYATNWIRQPAVKGLEWIGEVQGSSTAYKDSLKNKFSMSTASSSNTVTLTGQNVQPEDTAVYYCLYKKPSIPEHLEHEATRGGSLNGQALESIPSSPVLKKPGETLSLSCRGTGFTFSSFAMHWIRKPAGKGLEWMGLIIYDASETNYASSVQGRIEITRDNSNSMVYMRLSNLKPEDSAVYFCAKDQRQSLTSLS